MGPSGHYSWLLMAISSVFAPHGSPRRHLHVLQPLPPLRAVPGPKLWAVSQIPYILAWLSGHASSTIHAFHEQYGDVVRVAPNRLSFTHPDAYQNIRGHRKCTQEEHGKDRAFYVISRQNILGASREDHARFRRILSHCFSAKSMQAQQPLITKHVDLLMQRLRERTTTTQDGDGKRKEAVVDLAAWFNFTTFDIIGDLAFGEPFGCLEESRYHPWVSAIFRGVKQLGIMLAVELYLPGAVNFARKVLPTAFVAMDKQTEFANERIARRLQLETGRPDFVEAMVTANSEDGRMLTRHEMAVNARLLVFAGSETTATALASAAYFLSKYPEVQKKLADEVRSSFTSEGEIDLFSVNKLQYMMAVLDEAMRVFPTVPGHLPRTCHAGGDVICGIQVPAGTGLEVWPLAMNRSRRNFTEPDKFIPERWLPEAEYTGIRFDRERHGAFQPFSVGSRNCVGKNLAYMEMRLILARLIWNYDLVLADEAADRFLDCPAFGLWLKGPLHVRLIPLTTD
ncbi:cytochrome P450 [Parathielavia appendiculata]|uniref:Cytochrome P450 n=1 Tax=Parathielavia appendiculata TaxID=2587402 RepID=A0AAN6TQJ2_9PEZI|nr:cytochrome P450 [Parathielavia appendiculata]